MPTNKKIGVLGNGEVGRAITQLYSTPVATRDLTHDNFGKEIFDVLHVCIPFNENFIPETIKAVRTHCPGGLVFIHSTVAVGTTEHIGKELGDDGRFVVHSPIRGVHPNLLEGIKTFVKYIGADFAGAGRMAQEHLEELGVEAMIVYRSKATELLKLLDTTYYGLAISFHKYAADLCETENVNFDVVMTEANRSYNEGYTALGMPNVVRPVLKNPYTYNPEGTIGGHCVIPNAKILEFQYGKDPLLETILRNGK